MDLAVLGLMGVLGYHVQQTKNNTTNELSSSINKDSIKNIYNSDTIRSNTVHFQNIANNRFEKSMNPVETNIISSNNYNISETEKLKKQHLNNNIKNNKHYIDAINNFELLSKSDSANENKMNTKYFENVHESNKHQKYFKDSNDNFNTNYNSDIMFSNSLTEAFTPLTSDKMKHNNEVPFFGSHHVTPMLDDNIQSAMALENNGTNRIKPYKREVNQAMPVKDAGKHINGAPIYTQRQDAYITSKYKPFETPIESVTVGPGINKGYCAEGTDGFHSNYQPQYKTVDELRSKQNQKTSYQGKVIAGKNLTEKRSTIQSMERNRPERFKQRTQDDNFVTTGAVLKETFQPAIRLTAKKAQCITGHVGPTGASNHMKSAIDNSTVKYKMPFKKEQKSVDPSNAAAQVSKINSYPTDKAKSTIRETTGKNNYTGQGTYHNKGHAKYEDIAKTTIKQTTSKNNHSGYYQGFSRETAHAEDNMRTTGRQTIEDNYHTGNFNSYNKETAHAEDNFRTTGRQITEDNHHTGNLNSYNKETAHAEDNFRTTGRQITEDNHHTGNLNSYNKETSHAEDNFRTTGRQITEDNYHTGNLNSYNKETSHAEDNFRTTGRQINEDNYHTGNLNSYNKETAHAEDKFRTTGRQTNEDNYHLGNLNSYNKETAHAEDNFRTTGRQINEMNYHNGNVLVNSRETAPLEDPVKTTMKETTVEYTRDGNIQGSLNQTTQVLDELKYTQKHDLSNIEYFGDAKGKNKHLAAQLDDVKFTQKHELSNNEYFGDAKGRIKHLAAQQDDAKYTQKHELSNNEYFGDAKGENKELSRDAELNAHTNQQKEEIAKGRNQSYQGPKTNVDASTVNLNVSRQAYDECRSHQNRFTQIYNNGTEDESIRLGINQIKGSKLINGNKHRLDTGLYDSYRMNPLTVRKI